MLITVEVASPSIMSHHFSVCVVKTFKFWSLGIFEVYNAILLTRITMLCISTPESICFLTINLYSLTHISPVPQSLAPGNQLSTLFP